MKDLPLLKGKSIYLRGLHLEDAKGNYPHWFNNPEVTRYNSHGDKLYTQEMAEDYIRFVTSSSIHQVFAIIDNHTNKHIGNVALQAINLQARNAEFAILLGEPSFYGKGVGEEVGKLLLDYAFSELRLHRIYCGTSSNNIGMQRLALKLGMRQEGIRRDALTKNGKFADVIEYAILENDLKETL